MTDIEKKAEEIGKRPCYPASYEGTVNMGITIREKMIAEGMKISLTETLKSRQNLDSDFLLKSRAFANAFAHQTLLAMAEAEMGGGNG